MVGHHLLHLVGDAGHRVDDPLAAVGARDLAAQPRCGTYRIGDHAPTDRDVRLAQVVGGHVAAAHAEHGGDLLGQLLTTLELDPHDLRDRLARHVVGGRTEATADDDGVRAGEQILEGGDHPRQVVADLAVLERVDAHRRELLADPRAVRVDDLAEEQLGADRQNVTPHRAISFVEDASSARRAARIRS